MDRRDNRHVRSVSTAPAGIRRPTPASSDNRHIAKAAAQRLANVMAQQATDDVGDYDDDDYDEDSDDEGGTSDSPQFQLPVSLPSRTKNQSPSATVCFNFTSVDDDVFD